MKKTLTSMIRFGVVAALALTLFTGEAFAALVLTPASANSISETNAALVAKVSNPGYKVTTVWFEWGETQSLGNSAGLRDIMSEGFFQGYLYNLKPGTTYYFRAVALEDGITIYSSVSSFKTRGGVEDTYAVSSVQGTSISPGAVAQPAVVTNTQPTSSNITQSAAKTTSNATITKNTATNSNTAAVANVGNGILPGTLIGWVSLLIALLIIFLIFAVLLDSVEERRKAREAARKKQRLFEEEEERAMSKA